MGTSALHLALHLLKPKENWIEEFHGVKHLLKIIV